MQVTLLPANSIRVGMPLPVALRDVSGQLLCARGSTIESAKQLELLVSRGLYVDVDDSAQLRFGMAAKVDSLVRSNASLGAIAQAQPDAPRNLNGNDLKPGGGANPAGDDAIGAINSLLMRASSLLTDPQATDFEARVDHIDTKLMEMLAGHADNLLMVLIDLSTSERRQYSVSHSLLVAAVCELAASHIESLGGPARRALRRAALTMNIAMTALQNQLVLQEAPPTERQREQIDTHAARGAELLRGFGVADPLWLDAVEHHHASTPGPLEALTLAQQIARLLQRTDMFTARLSPRHVRKGLSPDAAARAAYLDENAQADEAGAAIIKALGIYPPGTFVRLANAEVAVVLKRGRRATEPRVASVISRSGTPLGLPAVRDTRLKATSVVGGVPTNDVKLRLNLPALLRLV